MSSPADSDNPLNFYSQAKECKFFQHWKPFPPFEGADFYHANEYMRFRFEGVEYLLGLNPRGFLVGFLNLSNPSQRADIVLLDENNAGGHPRAFRAAITNEQKVTELVLSFIPPPPSGNLSFPPRSHRQAGIWR
jgi:hypothetical protein